MKFEEYIASPTFREKVEFAIALYVVTRLYPRAIHISGLSRIIYFANRICATTCGYVRSHDVPVIDSSIYPGFYLYKLKTNLDRAKYDVRSMWYKYFDTRYGKIRLKFEHPNYFYGSLCHNFCRLLNFEIERYLSGDSLYGHNVDKSLGAFPEFPLMHGRVPSLIEVMHAWGLDKARVGDVLWGASVDYRLETFDREELDG